MPVTKIPAFLIPFGFPPPPPSLQPQLPPGSQQITAPRKQPPPLYYHYPLVPDHHRFDHKHNLNHNKATAPSVHPWLKQPPQAAVKENLSDGKPSTGNGGSTHVYHHYKHSPPSTRPWLNYPFVGNPTTTENAQQRPKTESKEKGSTGISCTKRKADQPSESVISAEMPQAKTNKLETAPLCRRSGRPPKYVPIQFELRPLLPKPVPPPLAQSPKKKSLQPNEEGDKEKRNAQASEKTFTSEMLQEKVIFPEHIARRKRGRPRLLPQQKITPESIARRKVGRPRLVPGSLPLIKPAYPRGSKILLEKPPPRPTLPKPQESRPLQQKPPTLPHSPKQNSLNKKRNENPDQQNAQRIASPLLSWMCELNNEQGKEVVTSQDANLTYTNEYLQGVAPIQILGEPLESSSGNVPGMTNLSKFMPPPRSHNINQSDITEDNKKAVAGAVSRLVSQLREALNSNQMIGLSNETFSYLDSVGVYYQPLYKAVHAFIYYQCYLEVAEREKDGPAFRARTLHHERVARLMAAKEAAARAIANANNAEQILLPLRKKVEVLKESLRKAEAALAGGEAKLADLKAEEICCGKAYFKAKAEVIETSEEMDKDYMVIDEVEQHLIESKSGKERMMDELRFLTK